MKTCILLFVVFGLVASCTDRDDDLTEVNIRIKNLSSFTFDEVQVGNQETVYSDVAPGGYSEYLPYETAYRYAYVSIKIGEDTLVLQPIDYVGEQELPIGLYTYELNVTAEGEILLKFVAD